jgi:16S rRNA (guanine1516-N2)-methyltransferase
VPSGRDLIARALGRHCCTIIDATAGFGFDAFDFAHRGKRVVAIERSTVVAELLADAVPRFLSRQPNAGLSVITGDSRYLLTALPPADVVFLDPMFPSLQQKSARSGKAQLMLRALVGDDNDAAVLARLARERALKRVVVKRPRHAPALDGPPDLTHAGRAVRYDVYLAGSS